MLKKINYNLIETLLVISKSLLRYEGYVEDSAECESCQKLWAAIKEQREKEQAMILKELKIHIEAGLMHLE